MAEWTPENNIALKLPDPTTPTSPVDDGGAGMVATFMALNPTVTLMQETWDATGSAYRALDPTGAVEVKVHLLDKVTGKRGITRHFVLPSPEAISQALPMLLAAETGIGLAEIIRAKRPKPEQPISSVPGRPR